MAGSMHGGTEIEARARVGRAIGVLKLGHASEECNGDCVMLALRYT